MSHAVFMGDSKVLNDMTIPDQLVNGMPIDNPIEFYRLYTDFYRELTKGIYPSFFALSNVMHSCGASILPGALFTSEPINSHWHVDSDFWKGIRRIKGSALNIYLPERLWADKDRIWPDRAEALITEAKARIRSARKMNVADDFFAAQIHCYPEILFHIASLDHVVSGIVIEFNSATNCVEFILANQEGIPCFANSYSGIPLNPLGYLPPHYQIRME